VPEREVVIVLEETFPRILVSYVNERVPLALPPDFGAKVVVMLTAWPGASVNGMLRPLKLNPVPDTLAWEIVRLEFPVLLRDADFDKLVPRGTLPKVTGEGLTDNCPAAAAANRKTMNAQDTHVDKGPIRFTLCFSCSMLKQHGGGFGAALSTTSIKSSQDEVHSAIVRFWVKSGKSIRDSKGQFCTRKCITDKADCGYVRRILRESRGNPTLDAASPHTVGAPEWVHILGMALATQDLSKT